MEERRLTVLQILRRYDIVFHDPLKLVEIWDPLACRTSGRWIRLSKRGGKCLEERGTRDERSYALPSEQRPTNTRQNWSCVLAFSRSCVFVLLHVQRV